MRNIITAHWCGFHPSIHPYIHVNTFLPSLSSLIFQICFLNSNRINMTILLYCYIIFISYTLWFLQNGPVHKTDTHTHTHLLGNNMQWLLCVHEAYDIIDRFETHLIKIQFFFSFVCLFKIIYKSTMRIKYKMLKRKSCMRELKIEI